MSLNKKTLFKGSGVAIITPFDQNDNIDFDNYKNLIEFQLKNHTDAIIVCGTTGEASALTDDEHKKSIEFVVETVGGRVPVIAGTGSNDTAYAIELSRFAEKAGADGLLSVTPYYNKTSQSGLVKHFFKIADSVNIPVVLYNVPVRTNLNILPSTYKKLSEHENIIATKEASGNISTILETIGECGDNLGFYSGEDANITTILAHGGLGVISTMANIIPKETHDICEAFFNGDLPRSAELQIKYIKLINALFCEVNPIPVKTAAYMMKLTKTPLMRMPLCEMEDKTYNQLESALKEYGLI